MSESNEIKIAKLEIQMENIEKKVDAGFAEVKLLIENQTRSMHEQFEQKADKWVEKTLIGIGSVVGLAVLGAVLSLVIIK